MAARILGLQMSSSSGQALLLILLFVIPMVLAFGLVVRTNSAVVMKIRAQNAADAAALAAGSQVSRVLNQVALHNMTIYKYHALCAALEAAIKGAKKAEDLAKKEYELAQKELQCWQQNLQFYNQCCANSPSSCCYEVLPFIVARCPSEKAQCTSRQQKSQSCVQCMEQQVKDWKKIWDFWQNERPWLERKLQSVRGSLGSPVSQLGKKSQTMVEGLDQEMGDHLFPHMSDGHGLSNSNSSGDPKTIYMSDTSKVIGQGKFTWSDLLRTAQLSEYEKIALNAEEPTKPKSKNDNLVAGIYHFEGSPPDFQEKVSKKDGGRQTRPSTYGATNYFLEYIYNVHFGVPGYFSYKQMHSPLGNPDTERPNCGGPTQHKGCEDQGASGAANMDDAPEKKLCGQPPDDKPCHRDQKDYTRDVARDESEKVKESENQKEFGKSETMYRIKDSPKMNYLVTARIPVDRGFFQKLFPAHTIDAANSNLPLAKAQTEAPFFYGLGKFELYNLTETGGDILDPDKYDDYPKTLMTQDWRTLLIPIDDGEVKGVHTFAERNTAH